MVKFLHYIDIKFFSKENKHNRDCENSEYINQLKLKMKKIIGDIPEIKNILIENFEPFGDFENKLLITKVRIEKSIKVTLKEMRDLIISNKDWIKETIDDDCFAYLRLDKKEFFEKGIKKRVDHGDCIHIKLKIAAYPAKKSEAIKKFEELIMSI